jgi:hypothetical protein
MLFYGEVLKPDQDDQAINCSSLLSKNSTVEVSDTTGDAICTKAGSINYKI